MAPRWRNLRTDPLEVGSELTRVVLPSPNAKTGRALAAQVIANNTLTAVVFNFEEFDNNDMVNIAAQPTRITIRLPGVYLFTSQVKWAANAAGTRIVQINKNGTLIGVIELPATTAGALPAMQVNAISECKAGDFVELMVYQLSGGNLNVDVATVAPYLSASWQT